MDASLVELIPVQYNPTTLIKEKAKAKAAYNQ
ncbi:hypothetical protein J2X69_003688 [Algoriphagus sp. 4150]|nr:hypothetical protein [Algoriphagus sp. 4150]